MTHISSPVIIFVSTVRRSQAKIAQNLVELTGQFFIELVPQRRVRAVRKHLPLPAEGWREMYCVYSEKAEKAKKAKTKVNLLKV